MQAIRLEDVACPLGCPRSDVTVLTGRDRIHDLPGEFTIVKCRCCGLMRTNPRPTASCIGFYYPDDYGPYLGTQIQHSIPVAAKGIKKIIKFFTDRMIDINSQKLPSLTPGRLLEVGCASGSYLHQMAQQGWQVQGIEFSEKAAQAARQLGHPVHTGALETAPKPEQDFDLIIGWMVLEHLHAPIEGLKKLREWAKPGARLVLSVPNAGSLEFSIFKDKWYSLHLPHHLYHFTPQTLEQLLDASGWTLEKIYHQRTLGNVIASTGYVLSEHGYAKLGQKFINFSVSPGRWYYAIYPLAWLLSLFGQTGRMTVWARVKN